MVSPELSQQWSRVRTAVAAAGSVIDENPKFLASVRPAVERALQILSAEPSANAVNEVEYLLHRVEQFVAQWRPKPKPSRGVFYVAPLWAKSTDQETQEALRLLVEIRKDVENLGSSPKEKPLKVFVSHSSADRQIAEAFVELLRSALSLALREIRCTSVDGYKLDAGVNADEQLRREVHEAETFVALLSPTSIKSIYVMFELGARWGAQGYLAPVMVAGTNADDLKAPLSAIHAVNGTAEAEVHQLLETLAARLSVQCEKPPAYLKTLHAFLDAAKAP